VQARIARCVQYAPNSATLVPINRSRSQEILFLAWVLSLGTLNATTARAEWDPKIEAACPEAVSERAQRRAARPTPKDIITVSRPALRAELLQMEQQDQDARNVYIAAMGGGELPDDHPASRHLMQVDAEDLRRLKHIIIQDGFPTIAMVGIEGVHAAFLLTQHADGDPAFQQRMLRVVAPRLRDGEITGNEYALLTDRVLRAQGKPQRYGTQFEGIGENLKPSPIADEEHVDKRRRSLGLISLANYSCVIHAAYDAPPHP
jgi:hypothetical protein